LHQEELVDLLAQRVPFGLLDGIGELGAGESLAAQFLLDLLSAGVPVAAGNDVIVDLAAISSALCRIETTLPPSPMRGARTSDPSIL